MGGALTLNSTLTPDLISANVTSVEATGTSVRYCFNKTIGTTPDKGQFQIATYDRGYSNTANSVSATGQCATAKFTDVFKPEAYTFASAYGGAVVNSATGTENNDDSTALVGSNTNNGTRGRTTAPDLTGIAFSGLNVTFQFDEPVVDDLDQNDNPYFTIILQDGTPFTAVNTAVAPVLSADQKNVTISFSGSTATTADVANAVRGFYNDDNASIHSESDSNDYTLDSFAAFPSSTGLTDANDPRFANLVSNGTSDQIDVVFDAPVVSADPTKFSLVMSNGVPLPVDGASVQNVNTVRLDTATTHYLRRQAESVVGVLVEDGAAVGSGNTFGFIPAGGNAGAFATGFTNGPEALATTFQLATNTATVRFDQRYADAFASDFHTVDNTGTVSADDATALSFGDTAVPGQTTIDATFNSLSGTRGLALDYCAAYADVTNACSVEQILAPIASSAG